MSFDTETVLDRFLRRAMTHPEERLYTFIDDAGQEQEALSCGEMLRDAQGVANHLLEAGLRPGDRALLLYMPSLDFARAFVGCLLARILPVPVAPPNPYNLERELPVVDAIAKIARPRAILTDTDYANLKEFVSEQKELSLLRALPWHTTSGLPPARLSAANQSTPSIYQLDDVAFVQYTSGSTSTPRGVLITHGNIRHQLSINAKDLGMGPESRLAMWVPHFHDFGLVSGILSALDGNGSLWWMSPLTFLQRPDLWFEVMSRVGATHTAAPNFAYELALRRTTPEQRRSWDLSRLKVVMSAAEPVRPETRRAFLEAFSASRLRPEAFCPAYGLAEHTVGVSVGGRARVRVEREALARNGRVNPVGVAEPGLELVGCGRPSDGVLVRIVDPETLTSLPAGRVGEIWVSSPSKAAGYDGLEEESRRLFQAELEGEPGVSFLRTGDLGFLYEGEIFVVGRKKDLIIVRGKNFHPQDIEEGVRSCHPDIRPGGVVAFALRGDAETGDRIALLIELKSSSCEPERGEEIAAAIRERVLLEQGQTCDLVLLAKSGAVLKTSSGKLRRQACRQAFERGELAPALLYVSRTPQENSGLDSLLDGIDEGFGKLVGDMGRWFAKSSRDRGGRMFHKRSTTLLGWLEVHSAPEIPSHPFFTPKRRLPVMVRHANGVQDDDAAWDNRGATVRVLDPSRPNDLGAPLLDLLLTTGRAFLAPSAAAFARWMSASPEVRDGIARENPHIAEAAWEMFRAPNSYLDVHYHSKTAFHFKSDDGEPRYVRYRLRPENLMEDGAFVRGDSLLPPDLIPRREGDTRSPGFLHEELKERLSRGAIEYSLELQLCDEASLDCTRPPDGSARQSKAPHYLPTENPWRRVARLRLESIADDSVVEGLRFNSANAPVSLSPVRAKSANDPASLEVLRALVYEISACARLKQPLSPGLAALVSEAKPANRPSQAPKPLRVCVLGAGASGLSAAWNLEQLGHKVTVLEREKAVAGKCSSIEVDGRPFDLGGHLCMPQYRELARLCDAVGAKREAATPTYPIDLETRRVLSWDEGQEAREAFLRYRALRDRELSGLGTPGLASVAKALSKPASTWLEEQGLSALRLALGDSFTSTGYGYLADPELPALYLVKAAETAGLLAKDGDPSLPPYWTITGGFQSLWELVAKQLKDVRTNVKVTAIERRGVVRVIANGERLEFDRLLVATPLDSSLMFLDATLEERDLFGQIQYRDYYTTVARAQNLPEQGFYILRQNNHDPARVGHCVAYHHRYPGSDTYLFYSYGDESLDGRDVERLLREDVARLGGSLGEVKLQRKWRYFPHVTAAAAREGYYDRLEALQGQNNTFYVGSLFNFELVECNVAYAADLCKRHFGTEAATQGPAKIVTRREEKEIASWLIEQVQKIAKLPPAVITPEAPLKTFSLDSLALTGLTTTLSDWIGWAVPLSTLYEQSTIERLARHLAAQSAARAPTGDTLSETARKPASTEKSRGNEVNNDQRETAYALQPGLPGQAARLSSDTLVKKLRGSGEMGQVRSFWREAFGVKRWFFDDTTFGFIDNFIGDVIIEDPDALARVKDRGCLYLANHQVAIEPAMIATIASGLSGKPIVGLAKIEGRDGYFGWFMEHMFVYPGVHNPGMYVYLDRSNPEELFLRINELAEALRTNERNVLVHVQGTRSTSCREPVQILNPMFIEMAMMTGAPIVPVRFTGGLPAEPVDEKLDVPYKFGKQDYWIGRPILTEELEPLGFTERSERVMAAINGLGPSCEIEEPGPPSLELRSAVDSWRERTGVIEFWATLWAVLERLPDPSPDTLQILEGAKRGELVLSDNPHGRWMAALARQLYGERGPKVTIR